jgi:hypothetical protein
MLEEIKEEQPACSVVWVSDEVSDACSRDPLLIGWAYQFWNEAARDLSTWAINRKDEERSAAYSVAAATQLFTEEYMTSFLCEHCVPLARSAVSEGQVDVLDPACESERAKFIALVVLPSPGRADVTTITLGGESGLIYCKLVLMVLNASVRAA